MNVELDNKHILQTIDWSRFDLEGWLYQFGAWMNLVSGTCGKSINPIAVAMDNAVLKQKKKKLTINQESQILVGFIIDDYKHPRLYKTKISCLINDNEARAVQRLILDMLGKSEVLDGWMNAIIDRYFYGNSWSKMIRENRTQSDARIDVKCGLAVLHSQYYFMKL